MANPPPPEFPPTPAASVDEVERPVYLESTGTHGDGGTTYFLLRGSGERRLLLCLTAPGGLGPIPGNTLFVDADHPHDAAARLPSSAEESRALLACLREAIGNSERVDTFRNATLQRLERVSTDIAAPPGNDGRDPPGWYRDYRRGLARKNALMDEADAQQSKFLSCFPEAARSLFEEGSDDPLTVQEIRARSAALLRLYDNAPGELLLACFESLDALENESWRALGAPELILREAIGELPPSVLASSLGDGKHAGAFPAGVGQVLFGWDTHLRLEEDEWTPIVRRSSDRSLQREGFANRSIVIDSIDLRQEECADELLYEIATGRLAGDVKDDPRDFVSTGFADFSSRLGHRITALLALCRRNHWDKDSLLLLADRMEARREIEQTALAAARSSLSPTHPLPEKALSSKNRRVAETALLAVKRYPTAARVRALGVVVDRGACPLIEEADALLDRLGDVDAPSHDEAKQ